MQRSPVSMNMTAMQRGHVSMNIIWIDSSFALFAPKRETTAEEIT